MSLRVVLGLGEVLLNVSQVEQLPGEFGTGLLLQQLALEFLEVLGVADLGKGGEDWGEDRGERS